jgi:hypothetical protein
MYGCGHHNLEEGVCMLMVGVHADVVSFEGMQLGVDVGCLMTSGS